MSVVSIASGLGQFHAGESWRSFLHIGQRWVAGPYGIPIVRLTMRLKIGGMQRCESCKCENYHDQKDIELSPAGQVVILVRSNNPYFSSQGPGLGLEGEGGSEQ